MFTVKKRPKLKSRYQKHVQAATEYAKAIDNFNDLVDARTLARHSLGPEPSSFLLHTIKIKEKSKCYIWFVPVLDFSFFLTSVSLLQR